MKKKNNRFIKTILACSICFFIFLGIGYLFLDKNFYNTDTDIENVPYTQQAPENAGILLDINNTKTFFYLDFQNEKLIVSLKPEAEQMGEIYGYPLDYKITTTNEILGQITDYLNGIELTKENATFRYTGAQILDLLKTNDLELLERDLITAICKKITRNTIRVDFFALVIQNSKTELSLIDCYFWADYMDEICKNVYFID